MKLVDKLLSDRAERDTQIEATLGRLKSLGKNMHTSSMLVDALRDCGLECWNQKQHDEELVYWQNAIELEKATQNDSDVLAKLFASKAGCLVKLERDQECIEASNLALKHDPNNTDALNNRGAAYFNLKQYSNAHQDLERASQLDPTYELVRKNFNRVQELINASSSQ